jgi:hypothetical protein
MLFPLIFLKVDWNFYLFILEKNGSYRISVVKPEEKELHGKPRLK